MRASLALLGLLLCLGAAACRSRTAATPVDWNAAKYEGRIAGDATALDETMSNRQHFWTDGMAELRLIEEGNGLTRAPRLILDAYGESGMRTPFLVDTGASATIIAADSPIAREATVYPQRPFRVSQGNAASGYMAMLPELRVGSMTRKDVAVAMMERGLRTDVSQNVLGLPDFFHAQLEHRNGRWVLRSRDLRLPPREEGWTEIRMVRGLPVITLRNPDGNEVYGLIDTGAYETIAVEPAPRGIYAIPAVDGSTAMHVSAARTVNWRGLNIGGKPIAVLVGMDALGSRNGRLTFNQSAWILEPR